MVLGDLAESTLEVEELSLQHILINSLRVKGEVQEERLKHCVDMTLQGYG